MTSLSHKDDYLETPPWVFKQIEEKTGLRFILDICATDENSKCDGYVSEEMDALDPERDWRYSEFPIFCNPPRSKNGKFLTKCMDIWYELDYDIVMLLCWNDLGNKYADRLRNLILCNASMIKVENLGKIKFYKDGIETKFPSRLTYFWVWLKHAG